MLLTVDIGNTNIKLGLYEGSLRLAFDMLDSKPVDFRSFILAFLYKSNIREAQLDDAILSSVVPSLTGLVISALEEILKKEPIVIDNDHHYGIEIDKSITSEIGPDLLVTCAYAYQIFKKELLIVSLGTATVIAHVNNRGVFKGCLIAPGFASMASTIFNKAALLPEFKPKKLNSFIGTNTIDCMNIGVYDGFIGMVRYLISGIKQEIKSSPIIIGCGGAGKEVAPYIAELQNYDADLVSTGLNYIYNKYIKNH